ncbi:MAG: TetR/AcrR family transcriptional regulator [Chitinophagales bacterium]
MKKTQKKILANAIQLFNKRGVGNVRLQDIAKKAGISAGNLSYHYKTKKDLMEAVLAYMTEELKSTRSANMAFLEKDDYISLIKTYLRFQIGHRFFYRDILEIISMVPEAAMVFEEQIQQMLNFSKNGIYLAIGKGIMLSEPHEGHYDFFAKNIWAILHSFLTEREVLGEEKISLQQVILAVLESHFPYLTEKGKVLFGKLKSRLPELIEEEKVGTV